MTPEFFYTYSPQDRFSRNLNNVTLLSSSGSTGKRKLFLTSPEDAWRTLPAMKQLLKTNWEIDNYDRVEIIVHTLKAKPGQPQWGAGYNMMRLISMVATDTLHINYKYMTLVSDSVAHIQRILNTASARVLIVLYACPSDAVVIVRELTDSGRAFEPRPNVAFEFMFIGEALPPYRLFQMAEWLKLIDPGLVHQKLQDILEQPEGREGLKALVKSFVNGFGSAELQTGSSGSDGTALWNIVMYLLSRHEPERVAPFVQKYFAPGQGDFEGNPFPWSVFKTSPNVFFLLGREDAAGEWSLDPPEQGKHYGPAFATSLAGAVVNCQLDYMHIWDMHELALLLKQETEIDIKHIAHLIGVKYGVGDMVLTNGRMDNTGRGGLDAAISWSGYNIYGHNLHTVASQVADLSGMFTAQSIDYRDGARIFWIHFEAEQRKDVVALQSNLVAQAVPIIESVNAEFARHREMLLEQGGEELFLRTVQIRVLPYGHPRFQREPGQIKHKYIRPPLYIDRESDHLLDPIAEGWLER
jgi:hypothetical protein